MRKFASQSKAYYLFIMILSMTGYGKASATYQGKKITAEIKSLNSKALDLSTRIAPLYREREMEIRSLIQSALERGKVEFSLWIEHEDQATASLINIDTVQAYRQQLADIAQATGISVPEERLLTTILRMPEVYTRSEVQMALDPEEWQFALAVTKQAIDQLIDFRRQEGEALQRKFQEKLDNIAALLAAIEPYEMSRVEGIRRRIEDGLASLKGVDVDSNRLEQEMIYYIEKLDISEEKQRLANHLAYFAETMADGHGQGKKLGFIAQEMGREINTTGSKSNQAEMQNLVVQMKDELEQIKEQVLNVL